MRKICVPVDFTQTAMNALKYALHRFKGDHISVLHVSPASQNTTKTEYSLLGRVSSVKDDLVDELRKVILMELNINEIPKNVLLEVKRGEAISVVRSFVIDRNIDTVIMGTRDKYDVLDKLIGTTSLALVKTLECPVYLIPKSASYKDYEKVIVAVDTYAIEHGIGDIVKLWNTPYNAFVKFLNIQNDTEVLNKDTNVIDSNLFSDVDSDFNYEIEHIKASDVSSAIINSAHDFDADLIISIPNKQNFFSALLFKSITKELIQKVSIPLLFIHETDVV